MSKHFHRYIRKSMGLDTDFFFYLCFLYPGRLKMSFDDQTRTEVEQADGYEPPV